MQKYIVIYLLDLNGKYDRDFTSDKYANFVDKEKRRYIRLIFFSILSPSNYEIKRDTSDRKDSSVDDIRISFNGIITKKANVDGLMKSSTSKS